MPGLSDVFNDEDNSETQSSDTNGEIVGDASSAVGLDIDSSQSSSAEDEDGNITSDESNTNIGLDGDTDGLLGSAFDQSSDSEATSD